MRYEQHIQRLEAYISELKVEVKQRDEEIERAIKVHRANERMNKELTESKALVERLKEELKSMRADRERDNEKYQQL